MKKLKSIIITTILTATFINNVQAFNWESLKTKSTDFITQDIPNFATDIISKTNLSFKPTPGIIPDSQEMLKQTSNLITNQTNAMNQIPKYIETLRNSNEFGNFSKDIETLDQINTCFEDYNQNTKGLVNFIKENGKITLESTKRLFGFGKKTVIKTEYPIHDSIAQNGLISSSPNYLVDLTKQQKDSLAEFEQCLENIDGYKKYSDKEWLKTFSVDKDKSQLSKQLSKQYTLAILEKLKYHTREILETITPDNNALKWALIIGTATLAAESIYALSYGIAKKDLRKGIANTMKFNWKVVKFVPWILPKYLLFKPANYAFQKAVQKIRGGQNHPDVNGQGNHAGRDQLGHNVVINVGNEN